MTWIDEFIEKAKVPPIASTEWLECIPPNQREEARRLVAAGTPVVVVPDADGWKVLFDETEFIAGAFTDHVAAVKFAYSWNQR